MARASIRASTLRNASHAEQSAPPEGTIMELRPRGLRVHQVLDDIAFAFQSRDEENTRLIARLPALPSIQLFACAGLAHRSC